MDIAIITARGGSKRTPRKNVRMFAGQPMLAWPIRAALDSGLFAHVVVSTEDDEIAETALKYGAEVPFRRPLSLADDFSGTCDVLRHALETLAYTDATRCCCLYGTSYAATPKLLKQAQDLLLPEQAELVMAAKAFPHPIERSLSINENGMAQYRYPELVEHRTQDLPTSFHDIGLFYYFNIAAFTATDSTSFIPLSKKIVEIPPLAFTDIDWEEDFTTAETLFKLTPSAQSIGEPHE